MEKLIELNLTKQRGNRKKSRDKEKREFDISKFQNLYKNFFNNIMPYIYII